MSDWVVISPPGGARNYLTVSLGKEYGYYKKDTPIWITDSNEYMVETNSLHYLHLEEYKEMYMKKDHAEKTFFLITCDDSLSLYLDYLGFIKSCYRDFRYFNNYANLLFIEGLIINRRFTKHNIKKYMKCCKSLNINPYSYLGLQVYSQIDDLSSENLVMKYIQGLANMPVDSRVVGTYPTLYREDYSVFADIPKLVERYNIKNYHVISYYDLFVKNIPTGIEAIDKRMDEHKEYHQKNIQLFERFGKFIGKDLSQYIPK